MKIDFLHQKKLWVRREAFVLIVLSCVSHTLLASEKTTVIYNPDANILSMLLGLSGVLIIIFGLAFLLKKFTGLNLVSNHIKVIESQNLGTKEKLVIVEIQEKQYVLGVTPNNINHVCTLDEKIQKADSKMSFDKIMQQLINPKLNKKNTQENEL